MKSSAFRKFEKIAKGEKTFEAAVLKNCRAIYGFGILALKIGMVLIVGGLIVGLLGKGWLICLTGIVCAVLGVIVGQVAESSLTSQMKFLVESLTAKEAHELAASHLQATGNEADDTDVFLGKFIGEIEARERQKKKQSHQT